jgi:hypothetical protein
MEAPAPAPIPPGSGRGFFFGLSWRDQIDQSHGVIAAGPGRRIASGLDTRRGLRDCLLQSKAWRALTLVITIVRYPKSSS